MANENRIKKTKSAEQRNAKNEQQAGVHNTSGIQQFS